MVKVLEVGLCGTDMEINEGLYGEAPSGEDFLIIGHESFGQIEAVGDKVEGLQPGDMVVATVRRPCPDNCINCRAGESDMCLTGNYSERGIKGLHGFMAEYYVETPDYLVQVPEGLMGLGVLLEPLSVVEKAISQAHRIQERMRWEPRKALVLGAGPIGLMATLLLRLRGIETYAFARSPKTDLKAEIVKKAGAHYISAMEDPPETLEKKLGPPDLIIEATGNSSLAFQAMGMLGPNGILSLAGISSGKGKLEVPADYINLRMVLGNQVVFGTVNAHKGYFQMGIGHLREFEEKWPGLAGRLITSRLPLGKFERALKREKGDIKTVLELGRPD